MSNEPAFPVPAVETFGYVINDHLTDILAGHPDFAGLSDDEFDTLVNDATHASCDAIDIFRELHSSLNDAARQSAVEQDA